jgi:hypothetical protein
MKVPGPGIAPVGWAVFMIVVTTASCFHEPSAPTSPPATVHRFAALSQRSDVLKNLELAYNLRRVDKIDQLLDAHFAFFACSPPRMPSRR